MAKSKAKLKIPDRKISETFLEFAEPLLVPHGPNLTEAQMEEPLKIAWTVWNAVVYADAGGKRQILDQVRASSASNRQVQWLIESLIERKRKLFKEDWRIIGEYTLFRDRNEIRLRAEARDPRPTT